MDLDHLQVTWPQLCSSYLPLAFRMSSEQHTAASDNFLSVLFGRVFSSAPGYELPTVVSTILLQAKHPHSFFIT